jgi:4-hydroxy-tetrahydrodipicolinate reductase
MAKPPHSYPSPLKIILSGYGKMGQMVEEVALTRKHEVIARIDPLHKIPDTNFAAADVIIDFTEPSHALSNVIKYAPLKKNIVMGTTGWYEHLPQVKKIVAEEDIGFFYSPNFSMGVNMFLKVVEEAAKLIDLSSDYDVAAIEYHHNQKMDAPSGTAKAIAQKLLHNIKRKREVTYTAIDRKIKEEEIHFPSVRVGHLAGIHEVIFDSPCDTITLTHSSKNREGLALGAVMAAEWLNGKKGFFTMEDYFQ